MLDVLIIYLLSSDNHSKLHHNTQLFCHLTKKTKLSVIVQFQFLNIFHIDILQNNLKRSNMDFLFFQSWHNILHIDKLIFIVTIFNVHLLIITKNLFFVSAKAYSWCPSFCVPCFFKIYYKCTYDSAIIFPTLVISFFHCTYNFFLYLNFWLSL